jgi:hypothetical protein
MPFEQQLSTLYAVSVPTELDRRIDRAMATVPIHRSGRVRPRRLAVLAIAAIFAITAAGPAVKWFEGWHGPFDRLWEISTLVDQTVTADGYRVTLHRAYVDRLGVRVAMSVQDLDQRWSGLEVDAAVMTDADGRDYEAWNWSGSRTPVDGSVATWARFRLPDEIDDGDRQLHVTVTALRVRAPDALVPDLEAERIWTSVGGAWSFEFDMPPINKGRSVSPVANASKGGVTISLAELAVVPSGTVVRLAVEGLPDVPTVHGWFPSSTIEHDGKKLSDQPFEPGVVGSDGVVTIEALPDEAPFEVEGPAGHWRITVHSFYGAEPALDGPWVLEFDVPETP